MNYKDRGLKTRNYNSSEKKEGILNTINQLILIFMVLTFYLNWSTAEIHNNLGVVLPVLTTVMFTVTLLLNIKKTYKDKHQFYLVIFTIIISLIGMMVNGSNLGVLFVIMNFSLMLLVSGFIKINLTFADDKPSKSIDISTIF